MCQTIKVKAAGIGRKNGGCHAHWLLLSDSCVHLRLCEEGVVDLIVPCSIVLMVDVGEGARRKGVQASDTMFTVADDIYNDVALECLAPLCSQSAHACNCFDIVTIHVEHGRLRSIMHGQGTLTWNQHRQGFMSNQNGVHLYSLGDVGAVRGRA